MSWLDTLRSDLRLAGRIRRLLQALVVLEGITGPLSAQTISVVRLKPSNAALSEEFSYLPRLPVRELRDGRVLIPEGLSAAPRLLVADFTANTVTPISRQGQGPGEFDIAGNLYGLPDDSTLMQAGMSRWLVLRGSTILLTSRPSDFAMRQAMGLLRGVDHAGSILSFNPRIRGDDSSTLVLVSRRSGKVTSVARLGVVSEPGYPPPLMRRGDTVFALRIPWWVFEDAHLFPDGWLAVARLQPYRVDWRSPAGKWILGAAIPGPRVKVDDREKQGYMERLANQRGTPVRPPSTLEAWPEFVPPFETSALLLGTPNGDLLVPRVPTVDHPETQYDVIDRTGRRDRQVVLARNERIVGFGLRSVYVAVTDDVGLQRIQRHAWP